MTIPRDDLIHAGEWLHEYYKSEEGLQRPEGLWIDGHPDWEGVGAWLLDVYVTLRERGQSDAQAKDAIVAQIRQSDEWRTKHPFEPGPRGPLPPLDPDDPPHPPEYPNPFGLRVTHMLLSKDFDGRNPDAAKLDALLDALLVAGAADKVCCFWEGNLFIDPQPVIQRIIDHVTARTVPAGVLTYVHFSPGVIAWQKDGETTADFWKQQVGKLTGLLHQVDPSQTAAQMQSRLNDALVRFGGEFGFPTDSGFGHPFDLVSDEVGASRMFDGASEDDGDKWGYEALCTPGPVPVMGFGNGARYPDGGVI